MVLPAERRRKTVEVKLEEELDVSEVGTMRWVKKEEEEREGEEDENFKKAPLSSTTRQVLGLRGEAVVVKREEGS